jgi:hypothetical protein
VEREVRERAKVRASQAPDPPREAVDSDWGLDQEAAARAAQAAHRARERRLKPTDTIDLELAAAERAQLEGEIDSPPGLAFDATFGTDEERQVSVAGSVPSPLSAEGAETSDVEATVAFLESLLGQVRSRRRDLRAH